MYLLFVGLTFLVAHVWVFSDRDLQSFMRFLVDGDKSVVVIRYGIAACLVLLFFVLTRLSRRLSRPMPGRVILFFGVALHTIHLLLVFGVMASYRPGAFLLVYLGLWLTPISLALILAGSGLALLGASPAVTAKGGDEP
jgi:hypothetical protein